MRSTQQEQQRKFKWTRLLKDLSTKNEVKKKTKRK